ncbi:pur operon repressor [Streptococcus sanguinis]
MNKITLIGEKMKLRRSERMVVISNYLINHPYELTSLNTFAEKYESAKSSISEDIVIIKRAFEEIEIGTIETITGAGGGVIFSPSISDTEAKTIVQGLCDQLSESNRILPGGYIYLSDLLSTPSILNNIGRIIAKSFKDQQIDAVMTVATKGVPLANAVANVLNVPFVIVRRDLKITEGSTVSVNYVSGSSGDRIEKMFLSKRSLKAGSRVLIVDDFLKGGGTITGMISLLSEFDSELAGVAVFADNAQANRDYLDYKSLLKVTNIDVKTNTIDVEIGNIFD